MKQLIKTTWECIHLKCNISNKMDSDFGEILINIRQIFFKNWQANTSEVDLDLHSEHMPEERITESKTDLNLSVRSTNTRVYMVNMKWKLAI